MVETDFSLQSIYLSSYKISKYIGKGKEFLNKMISLRPASPDDRPFIKECIKRFRLDDEDLDYRQFVVAMDGKEIAGFGRVHPHKKVYELGCVGVVKHKRNQGIGRMIVQW